MPTGTSGSQYYGAVPAADTNTYDDTYSNCYSISNAYSYANGNTNTDADSDGHRHA